MSDDSLGFLICDTARYVKRVLYARLAPYGIPGSCWFVLRALWQQDGISQRELSDCLGLAEPTLMMTLRTMERLGLVTRQRDEVDKRRMRVLLTDHAQAMKAELIAVADEVNRTMLFALSTPDRAAMVSGLRCVHTQLQRACDGVLPPTSDESADEPKASPKVKVKQPTPAGRGTAAIGAAGRSGRSAK
jgi:DNA-binding MarR family transcriptional regulator